MKTIFVTSLKIVAVSVMLSVSPVMMSDDALPGSSRVVRVPRVIKECKRPPREAFVFNDVCRHALDVDQLHAGVAVGAEIIPFTGKGVVIGIIDSGIEPRHPAFSNPSTGNSRIALYITTNSVNESKKGEFTYKCFSPMEGEAVQQRFVDFSSSGHGTHTSGTAAGADCGVPYYGVAPEATLVMTSMGERIFDDEIAFGITSALDYAREHGMPCVASLSLGSCTGLHDGTGMTTELLSEELDDKGQIVCFAAGNDGANQSSIYHDFSIDPTPLATVLHRGGYGAPAPGASTVFVCSNPDMQIAFSLVEIGPEPREVWRSSYINYKDIAEQGFDALASCPDIAAHLSGESCITLYTTEGMSGVHAIEIQGELDWQKESSKYTLGVIINLPGGGEVRGFTEFTVCGFGSFNIDGYTGGDSSQSISDNCTSPYVISVGAVNERASYTAITGEECKLDENYYGPFHTTASYTSYGTIPYKLPHTMAPGTDVISALNDRSTVYTEVCEITDAEGTKWRYGASSGTSMSTPAIAGVIALWLQADPGLTRDDVLGLLEYAADPAYGADRAQFGVPSAYKGLKRILEKQSSVLLPGIMPEHGQCSPHRLMLKYLDSEHVEAVVPFPAEGGAYTLYTADGQSLAHGTFTGNALTVSIPSSNGICILSVTTPQGPAIQKLAPPR